MVGRVELPSPAGTRILEIKILPVADGVTLLWHDVTERTHAEQALKRHEERLALRPKARTTGCGSGTCGPRSSTSSSRWRAMIGLPATCERRRPRRLVRSRPSRRHRPAEKGARGASRGPDGSPAARTPHSSRGRHLPAVPVPRRRRREAPGRAARLAGSLTDLTEVAARQRGIRSVAGTLDPLTGLCNRAVFVERLGRRLDVIKARPAGGRFAVAVSRPRSLQGRQRQPRPPRRRRAADRRCRGASSRACGRETRWRGWAATSSRSCSTSSASREQANAIAFRIQDALNAPFSIGGREVFTSASIGIAFGRGRLRQPGRDHARRRHGDVSREVARQGAARAVRRRHARARARPPRPRERPAPRGQDQRLRGALPADRAAGLADVRRVRVPGPVDAQRRSRSRRPPSSRSPRNWG